MSLLIGAATVLLLTATADVDPDLETVCAAPTGQTPRVGGVSIRDEPAVDGDLAFLRVTSDESGAFMKVYYDAGSEAAARSKAVCLGAQLALLERETGDLRRDAEWASAAFVQDRGYVPPRGADVVVRWPVSVEANGALPQDGHAMVVNVLPHEQVHTYQTRAGAWLPRWVAEGHATWVQGRIAPLLDPGVYETQVRYRETELATSESPLSLAQWGSARPRREAIMRQVSPEDRARMEADPNFLPTGAFRFGPGDLIQDEGNTIARYAAAAAIFDGLEARHGAEAVRRWISDLTSNPGPVTPPMLAESVQRHFGEEVGDLLAERPRQTAA